MKRLLVVLILLCLLGGVGFSEARYIDNGDGTVTDTQTNLMWQQATAPYLLTWGQAQTYCKNLTLAGYSDWRLPEIGDLGSLVDTSYTPTIHPDYFSDTRPDWYWTISGNYLGTYGAVIVNFNDGSHRYQHGAAGSYYVRAVRAVVILNPDLSFVIPKMILKPDTDTYMEFEVGFKYVGEQNGKLMYELDYIK